MHTVAWPSFVLWGFVALAVAMTVYLLTSRRKPLWVVVVGGLGAAVGSYLLGMFVLVVATFILFSAGHIPFR